MILQGDCLEILRTLDNESVNCVVTSPPYWALRDYGVEGQLGLEPTFQEYIDKLCDIFDEVKRVLRNDGTCWVNMGDTYNANWRGGKSVKGTIQAGNKGTHDFLGKKGTADKCLLQIPSRFAIEMTNRGWILRNEIIWHKPNCMPSSVKDRFTVDFEKVFFFVKNKKYWFEQQFEPHKTKPMTTSATIEDYKGRYKEGTITQNEAGKSSKAHYKNGKYVSGFYGKNGRNKRTVWRVTTKPYKEAHFATYPEELIEPMIKAGCPEFVCKKCGKPREKIVEKEHVGSSEKRGGHNIGGNVYNIPHEKAERRIIGLSDCGCNAGFEGGVVLDPFFGAGTTGLVALKQNKKYIGIELNPEYIKIAEKRIETAKEQEKLAI